MGQTFERLSSDRYERLLLAANVEQCLRDSGDEDKLRLLDACYHHIDVTPFGGPERYLRGDLRDVGTLIALARQCGVLL